MQFRCAFRIAVDDGCHSRRRTSPPAAASPEGRYTACHLCCKSFRGSFRGHENAPFTCVNAQFRPSWSRWPGKLKPSLSNAPRGPSWPSISGKWPTISGRDNGGGGDDKGHGIWTYVRLPYITEYIGKSVVHLNNSPLSSISKSLFTLIYL